MAKFLVTGGAGFIGSNFLIYMVNKYPEDEFICLDSLTYAGNINNLKNIINKANFKFIHESITKKSFIFKLFKNEHFDYVVNFAAESHVDRSIKTPDIFIKTNVNGTVNLLNACKKYNVKRFHQVSTDEVYGALPLDKTLLFEEESVINPSSPYSASKASADLIVLAYYKTFGIPVTISRCSNNYGPYQFPEKLIPLTIMNALNNKNISVYGTGENVRDWIYVLDHVKAIDLIVRNGKNGEVYNVSSNNEKSNIDVVKAILKYLNITSDLISFVADRPGHDLRYALASTKIRSELGYKPSYSFDEGLKFTIEWYLNNIKWLKEIEEKNRNHKLK